MYFLLDANVTAGYYLSRSLTSKKARERIEIIFDSVRSGEREHFFYIPNFCVAEVFSVFMKYCFGTWNSHVKRTIDARHYNRIVKQFQDDIHNGRFLYHYELSRYYVLGINHVAPIDHYFQVDRKKKSSSKKSHKKSKKVKANVRPMGTLDHLIISMGIHLAHVHGRENVVILSADHRLTSILAKCKSSIPAKTKEKLYLKKAETLTGKKFGPDLFPQHLDLISATTSEMTEVIGEWPMPIGKVPKVGRYTVV